MPELPFHVVWPDGSAQRCFSPSTVVAEHLEPGAAYPVDEFVARSRAALTAGSDRVRAKHGFACTSAAAQLEDIERRAAGFAGQDEARVRVERFGA